MTLTSGLFLLMQPQPVAPFTGITLQSIDRQIEPEQRLFNVAQPNNWQGIVIHDSQSLHGSSRLLNQVHEQAGRGGLGYHFVINNGTGVADGTIEMGFRWHHQFAGAFVEGDGADWFNRHAIGICLIGDADQQRFTDAQLRELVWLVQRLQKRFDIPREAVYIQLGGSDAPARYFPHTWFRRQLLDQTTLATGQ